MDQTVNLDDDIPVEVMNLDEDQEFKEWKEYRDYVRQLECVACQWKRSSLSPEAAKEQINLAPELAFISDPHHVKTRGSGGPDAENIVPLCRFHHQEFHNMGVISFQVAYDLNLKEVAVKIFAYFHENYLPTIIDQQDGNIEAQKVFAEHQRLLSRIYDINTQSSALGTDLIGFISIKRAGRFAYEWLGFKTMIAYITAPHSSGGLNIKKRTGHRLMCMAQSLSLLDGDTELIAKLGAYKSELIYPVIRKIQDPDERRSAAMQVSSMSLGDAISWQSDQKGIVDKRKTRHEKTVEILIEFFESISIIVEKEAIDGLAWKIVNPSQRS